MKRLLILNLVLSLFVATGAQAQEKDCGQLWHDYQVYKNHNQLSEMAATLQQGLAQNCSSLEYEIAKNHRNNNNFDKYVEYLNLAASHDNSAAKCDLLTLFEAGTVATAPAITREECQGQALGKTEDVAEETYFEHPAWSQEERERIWEENYNASFTSFNDPFDYNRVDFERIDQAWKNTKIGLGLVISGLSVFLAGTIIGLVNTNNDALFYTGVGIMSASSVVALVGVPFLATNNRLLRQGGVKFRMEGVVVTYNGVGVAYSQRFPYRPGYKVRHGHYVKIKQQPRAMLTPTFSKDFKGLSLVATW